MGSDFSVHHAELADAAADLDGLAGRATELAGRVKQALTGMAEAAGHPGLAGAPARPRTRTRRSVPAWRNRSARPRPGCGRSRPAPGATPTR